MLPTMTNTLPLAGFQVVDLMANLSDETPGSVINDSHHLGAICISSTRHVTSQNEPIRLAPEARSSSWYHPPL